MLFPGNVVGDVRPDRHTEPRYRGPCGQAHHNQRAGGRPEERSG